MTKQKQVLHFFANIFKIIPKNLIHISIQTLYSVLCWSTFGSDYRLVSSWVWRYKRVTPEFVEFLPIFSADPLKHCQVEWGESIHSYFQPLQRCSIGFKSELWLCHSRTFRDLSRSHSCVVLSVCLGSSSEVLGALEKVFIKDLSVLCSVHLSLDPD